MNFLIYIISVIFIPKFNNLIKIIFNEASLKYTAPPNTYNQKSSNNFSKLYKKINYPEKITPTNKGLLKKNDRRKLHKIISI